MRWKVHSQQEMEAALQAYFAEMPQAQAGKFNAMLKPQLAGCSFAEKSLTIAMDVEDWMVNPADILHGGIEASIADFTMGLLSRICSGGALTPTVSMTVSYIRSARSGDRLLVCAECVRCGATLSNVSARAWCADEPEIILLTASATYYTGGNARAAKTEQATEAK